MPQPNARAVGSSVAKMGRCPMVKYSTQTRAVTWSWRMPYATAAPMHSSRILRDSIGGLPPWACGWGSVSACLDVPTGPCPFSLAPLVRLAPLLRRARSGTRGHEKTGLTKVAKAAEAGHLTPGSRTPPYPGWP
jgi:hypothetical protein